MELKIVIEDKKTKDKTYTVYKDFDEFFVHLEISKDCLELKMIRYVKDSKKIYDVWFSFYVAEKTYYVQMNNDYFVLSDIDDCKRFNDFYFADKIDLFVKECKNQANLTVLKKEFEK